MKIIRSVSLIVPLLALFLTQPAFSKFPTGFRETAFIKGLSSPATFGFAPDGRVFICEQTGEVRIFKEGKLLDALFIKLNVDSQGEHGVLGITFDPNFATNHFVYIYHTALTPYMHNRVSRFPADQDVTTMASEKIILDLDDIQGSLWHSAGALTFGPDGKLYVGVGENGGRPFLQNAQLLTNPFGKVFRINSDGTIPADNPFYAQTTGIYRGIWALGFRNPFTFSFQAGTGRFFVNDVGADSWEEINDVVQGGNFGWPNNEGTVANTTYRNPIFTYPHGPVGTDNVGCAITGGTFYNPAIDLYPSQYVGKYFFIDYCNNWMRTLNPDHSVTTFATDLSPNPISLQVGPDGAFYYISFWFKNIYRIGYKAPQS